MPFTMTAPTWFIDSPQIIEAGNVPMATMSLIDSGVSYPCINEEDKVITVIQSQ